MSNDIPTMIERPDRKAMAKLFSKTMQCNCDLDNWQPEPNTGHSCVCRIHDAAINTKLGDEAYISKLEPTESKIDTPATDATGKATDRKLTYRPGGLIVTAERNTNVRFIARIEPHGKDHQPHTAEDHAFGRDLTHRYNTQPDLVKALERITIGLPKVRQWDNERPSWPVGSIINYRGHAHEVIATENQGVNLACISNYAKDPNHEY